LYFLNIITIKNIPKNIFYLYDIKYWNFKNLFEENGKVRKPKIDIYIYVTKSYAGRPRELRVCWKPSGYELDNFYNQAILKKGEEKRWKDWNDTDWVLTDFIKLNNDSSRTSFNLLLNIIGEEWLNRKDLKSLSYDNSDSKIDQIKVNSNFNSHLINLLYAIYNELIEKLKYNFEVNELNEIELVFDSFEELDFKYRSGMYNENNLEDKTKLVGYKLKEKELSDYEKKKHDERKAIQEKEEYESMHSAMNQVEKYLNQPELKEKGKK